jgi:hypothetical protein
VPPRRNPLADYHIPPPPRRADIVAEQAPLAPRMSPEISESVLEQAGPEQALSEQVVSEQLVSQDIAPVDDSWQQALDISAMQERYPLLRNAL